MFASEILDTMRINRDPWHAEGEMRNWRQWFYLPLLHVIVIAITARTLPLNQYNIFSKIKLLKTRFYKENEYLSCTN